MLFSSHDIIPDVLYAQHDEAKDRGDVPGMLLQLSKYHTQTVRKKYIPGTR